MKKNILLLSMLIASALTFSQTQLDLKINHKLGASTFAFNTQKTNNLGNQINITRLEYYLTVVSITHDGGTVTPIDKVLLVNASSTTIDSLTSLTITNLEKVTLAVGVKSSLNHNDPSLLASSHPLAPKSPSMHWGWTPGYRFVAMEGRSFSVSPDRQYELHSLGDVNYFYTTISTAGISTTGKKTIEINADYLEAVRDIDVANGPLDHGEIRNNKKHLENFRDYVFTSVEGNPSVGVEKLADERINFSISPNPSKQNEQIVVELEKDLENSTLVIIDVKGRIVSEQKITSKRTVLLNLTPGIYICSIKREDEVLGSRKFVVTK